MPEPGESPSPETIAAALAEGRRLHGAAVRGAAAALVRLVSQAAHGRLHRRRLLFAGRFACQ